MFNREHKKDRRVGLFLATLVGLQQGLKIIQTLVGKPELTTDYTNVWHPTALAVLDGAALYIPPAVDNKPPLFQFLNLLVHLTPRPAISFLILIGICNLITAILLYWWVDARFSVSSRFALLVASIYVLASPLVAGTTIQTRSFTMVALFLALLTARGWLRGALIAIGGLFTQWAVVGIPVLAYAGLLEREFFTRRDTVIWLASFASAGLATVALSYVLVALVWGVDAAIYGVEYTVFAIDQVQHANTAGNIFITPGWWVKSHMELIPHLFWLFIPASFGAYLRLFATSSKFDRIPALLCIVYALPLLIFAHPYYYIPVVAFAAILVGDSILFLISGLSSDREQPQMSEQTVSPDHD